jgi:rhodanese-related sulfurtransferase
MNPTSFSRTTGYEDLSAEAFRQGLANDAEAVLLDVRTPGEFREGYIPGAKNIDVMGDFHGRIANLDKSKTYYVYCRSGGRSGRACQIMLGEGFEKVYNLGTGIMGWRGDIAH